MREVAKLLDGRAEQARVRLDTQTPQGPLRIESDQAKVRQNVILSGGSGLIRGLGAALQKALKEIGGGQVRVVKDPIYVGSDGGLALATDAPKSDWEKLSA